MTPKVSSLQLMASELKIPLLFLQANSVFVIAFSISPEDFTVHLTAKADGLGLHLKEKLMLIKAKNKDNTTKTSTNNGKAVKISSSFPSRKIKKTVSVEQNAGKNNRIDKTTLIGRTIVCAVILTVIAVAYIYVEGQAQAEPQKQSRMQIIYELYNASAMSAEYDKKQIIREVLSEKGVENNLCFEIAETIVEESKKTDIPIEMYLAIMQKESTFRKDAVSSAYAKGLMQIQLGTWDAYVKKYNLPVTRQDIFLPAANIQVASVILKDLYGYYAQAGYEEHLIWDYVLAAYYAGPASVRSGIKTYHQQYINKVKEYYEEFSEII